MTSPDLNDVEPDALREVEFGAVQSVLDTMVGKRITAATIEETRIAVTTEDGETYCFYGFLGSDPDEDEHPEDAGAEPG